jgi:hypothetical protein
MEKRYAAALLAGLSAACGTGAAPAGQASSPDTLVLSVTDTIGVPAGSDTLTFGFITGAAFTPDGNVAVLDAQKAVLQVFEPGGREVFRAGGYGSGPGEFLFPVSLAVLEDGFAVSDLMGGKLVFFDRGGGFVREVAGFFPTPPWSITGCAPGLAAGAGMRIETGDDGAPAASVILAAWRDSAEPETVFLTLPVRMEGGRIAERPDFHIAGGPGGTVFFAEQSDSMLLVLGFTQGGERFLEIREPFSRIPRTEEELQEEALSVSLSIVNGESTLQRNRTRDERPFRTIVTGLGVDSLGRIWLEMGITGASTFRVYSPDGLEYSEVRWENPEAMKGASCGITPFGFVAGEPDPADWPKVYLIEAAVQSGG